MRIRILILDPHWGKIDPDPGHEHLFKIYWIFLTKQNRQIIFLLFSLIFMLKLDEPFRDQEFFCSFWLIFYPLHPDSWIHIFLRIKNPGSQNLAEPTNLDPKHWLKLKAWKIISVRLHSSDFRIQTILTFAQHTLQADITYRVSCKLVCNSPV